MTETEGSHRFSTLDGEKYGKNSALSSMESDSYSEGVVINASEIADYTNKSEPITECNKWIYKEYRHTFNNSAICFYKSTKTCL